MSIPFRYEDEVTYGVVATLTPLIRRVVAHNPSAFTYHGTGTYIIGHGRVAVVDPGPALPEHVAAIQSALADEEITHLLVTHTHLDHSPATPLLKAQTSARSYGYGPHGSGAYERGAQVEEGADLAFVPDVAVRDGDLVEGDGWSVECVHTPGHTSNHICYGLREEKALFSGDHVMGWSTTIVSPPDGDMGEYLRSLDGLLARDDAVYWPTHGTCIDDPKPFVRAYRDHRLVREAQILRCLGDGVTSIAEMVPIIYRDLPVSMHSAAARQVFAAMLYLLECERVVCETEVGIGATYRSTGDFGGR